MKSTWILVADNTHTRFFTAATPASPLVEIAELNHIEGRLHDREITSDLPGRIKSADGSGHALEQATDPKYHESDKFAHRVAQYLNDAYNNKHFEQLLLIAEPSFLGLLRRCLPEQIKARVTFELAKNITAHNIDDIRKHLPDYLPNA
jgi:protein required for attachment to host cells